MATAVLVDGGTLEAGLAAHAAAPGLLPVGGRPVAARLVEELRRLGDVDRLFLAGPEAYLQQTAVVAACDTFVPLAEPPAPALAAWFAARAEDDEVLLWSAGGALLSAPVVEQFLRHAPRDASLVLSAVRAAHCDRRWPGHPFGHVERFDTERIHFTPLTLLRPARLGTALPAILSYLLCDLLRQDLLRAFGLAAVLRYTTGRLSLDEAMRHLAEHLGGPVVTVLLPQPELCVSLRTRLDYNLVRETVEVGA